MALTKGDIKIIVEIASAVVSERIPPTAAGAVSVTGSYDPNDGTHQAIIGTSDAAADLAAALGDTSLTRLTAHPRVPIGTHDPNDQYGPRGSEQTVLVPSQGEWLSFFVPSPSGNKLAFPSIKAPSGERWILHRNADGAVDSGMQLTNDGPTPADGLGGTVVGNKGALTQAQTASGHQVTLNDTAQTIGIRTAGGIGGASPLTDLFDDVKQAITRTAAPGLLTIWDSAGNAISHVVPTGGGVGVGALFADLPTSAGAINNDILATFGLNINSANLQTLINFGNAMITAGIPNASSLIPLIVSALIQKVNVPNGSSVVRILTSSDGGDHL